MQSGELIVTGHGKVDIILNDFPSYVVVEFNDDHVVVPCNPHHHDKLEWNVHRSYGHRCQEHGQEHGQKHDHGHGHHYKYYTKITLKINWQVTGVREIKWTAYY